MANSIWNGYVLSVHPAFKKDGELTVGAPTQPPTSLRSHVIIIPLGAVFVVAFLLFVLGCFLWFYAFDQKLSFTSRYLGFLSVSVVFWDILVCFTQRKGNPYAKYTTAGQEAQAVVAV